MIAHQYKRQSGSSLYRKEYPTKIIYKSFATCLRKCRWKDQDFLLTKTKILRKSLVYIIVTYDLEGRHWTEILEEP